MLKKTKLLDVQDSFQAWARTRYAVLTVKIYIDIVSKFVSFTTNKSIDEITVDDVSSYHLFLKSKRYADSTIAMSLVVLRRFFDFLSKQRLIAWDPDLIKVPRYLNQSHRPVTESEVNAMIGKVTAKHFGDLRDKTLFAFLFASGLRVSEVADLCVNAMDIAQRYAVIVSKKNMLRRMVFWDDRTARLLTEYLPAREELTKVDNLFISFGRRGQVGGKLTPRQIERVVVKYRTSPSIVVHSFRHGLGVRCVKANIHPRNIQKILGHKNINSSQIYMQVFDQDTIDAYKKLSTLGLGTSAG